MELEDAKVPVKVVAFAHPNNITFGAARLIWAEEVPEYGRFGVPLKSGWVLPGGLRTSDREHAYEVAAAIDRMTRTHGA